MAGVARRPSRYRVGGMAHLSQTPHRSACGVLFGCARRGTVLRLDPRLLDEIKKHPAAWRCFEQLAPSHRRRYVAWIVTAKQEETKARRLKEAIRMLSAGKTLGLK